jgi:F1F0 ATPase subunit 2
MALAEENRLEYQGDKEPMTETTINLAAALAVGMLLGVFYFGTLWLTVRNLTALKYPMGILTISYAARLLVTLGGFYLLVLEHWSRPAAALLGFVMMRGLFIRKWALPAEANNP